MHHDQDVKFRLQFTSQSPKCVCTLRVLLVHHFQLVSAQKNTQLFPSISLSLCLLFSRRKSKRYGDACSTRPVTNNPHTHNAIPHNYAATRSEVHLDTLLSLILYGSICLEPPRENGQRTSDEPTNIELKLGVISFRSFGYVPPRRRVDRAAPVGLSSPSPSFFLGKQFNTHRERKHEPTLRK